MREIRFRVWDPYKKKMEYSTKDDVHSSNDIEFDEQTIFMDSRGNWRVFTRCDDATWNRDWTKILKNGIGMQYIDHKDKNGKEIYEDDILKVISGVRQLSTSLQGIYEVYYNNDTHGFRLKKETKSSTECAGLLNTDIVEVIGNIYESPELLEKEE